MEAQQELRSKERTFKSIHDYFQFIADTMGYPPLFKEFEEDYVYSGGHNVHVDVLEFSKQAPTIVFVPGTAIYAMCYAEILYKIAQRGYNIVGLDPRGHGRSEGPRGDYTITEIIKDVENVIGYAQKRFNNDVSLLGSSQGGIVSFYVAAKNSGRIRTAVCQNFADLTAPETVQLSRHPRLMRYLRPTFLKYGHVIESTQIPIALYLELETVKVKYFGNAKNFMENDPLALQTISFRALKSLANTALPRPVEEIKTPVMVFQGTDDTIFPINYTQQIYDRLNCKKHFQIFEGMDHAIMTEEPDVLVDPIVNWLDDVH